MKGEKRLTLIFFLLIENNEVDLVSLTYLTETLYNICMGQRSNPYKPKSFQISTLNCLVEMTNHVNTIFYLSFYYLVKDLVHLPKSNHHMWQELSVILDWVRCLRVRIHGLEIINRTKSTHDELPMSL